MNVPKEESERYLLDNEAASPFWHIGVYVCACFDKKKCFEETKSRNFPFVFLCFGISVIFFRQYMLALIAVNYATFVFTCCAVFLTGNA